MLNYKMCIPIPLWLFRIENTQQVTSVDDTQHKQKPSPKLILTKENNFKM